MKTETFSAKEVASIIGRLAGSDYPDPENPAPPGPWDPIIRGAFGRLWSLVAAPGPVPWLSGGPVPDPWQIRQPSGTSPGSDPVPNPSRPHHPFGTSSGSELFSDTGGLIFRIIAAKHPEIWDIIGGGPIPVPWKTKFASIVASEFIARVNFMQEFADATEQRQINLGGHVRAFVDDICGNDFRWMKKPPSKPPGAGGGWPPEPDWLTDPLGAEDLAMMGAQFHRAASGAFNPMLKETFGLAASRLVEVAVSRVSGQ